MNTENGIAQQVCGCVFCRWFFTKVIVEPFPKKKGYYYFLNQSSLIWLIQNVCSFPSFCQVGTEAAHKGEQNLKLVCLTKRTSQKDHDIHNRKRKKAEDYALFVVPREDSHHISPKQLNVSPKSCKSFKLHVLPLSESSSTEGVPQFSYHELSLSHRVGSFKYWFLCLICFLFSS